MTPLVDAHNHLQEEIIAADVEAIIARALDAGVATMVCNGTAEDDWEAVAALARAHPQIVPCYGLHPWFADQRSEHWLQAQRERLREAPAAIGEIGLDRLRSEVGGREQEEVFRAQLELARELHLPVTVHCLRAWGWLLEVLRGFGPLPGGLLLHSYGGSVEMVAPFAALGACFSFSGAVLSERRLRARAALLQVPLDRLLLESDAPALLPPEPYRRHVLTAADGTLCNEPANLPLIVEGVADLLGLTAATLAKITTANAQRFLEPLWR